jgi:hypothetical protein
VKLVVPTASDLPTPLDLMPCVACQFGMVEGWKFEAVSTSYFIPELRTQFLRGRMKCRLKHSHAVILEHVQ